jgi:predicted enzyme related to lactoylglutathione lyase
MVSAYEDLTIAFNANAKVQIDVSQYDYVLVHIITPSAAISFNSTLDSGAVTGATDGNASSATNWTTCLAVNQLNGTAESSTASGNSIHEFDVVGRYIQLTAAAGTTVTKLLIMYTKIQ